MYTVDYFIDKFSKIPEDKWQMGGYHNKDKTKFCAFGHCGIDEYSGWKSKSEADALLNILPIAVSVNDGEHEDYRQLTPKQRILAALNDIKKKMISEPNDKRSVATDDQSELPYADQTKKFTELIPVVDETADCEIKIISD